MASLVFVQTLHFMKIAVNNAVSSSSPWFHFLSFKRSSLKTVVNFLISYYLLVFSSDTILLPVFFNLNGALQL